jgi:Uma2 family endonuclease
MAAETTRPVRTRRWTRAEYERLIERGFFRQDERLELIAGKLIVREPQGASHHAVIELVAQALRVAFGAGWFVRVQGPIALDAASEPEPDVSVVPGTPRDYVSELPASPVLVVEVSETTLAFDRRRKASLYARAGIADYWVVDLVGRRLEVYREPITAASPRSAAKYRTTHILGPADTIAPLAAPSARIRIADVLP